MNQSKKQLDDHDLLEYILKVSRHMAETRMLKPLLTYVVDEVFKLTGAERGYIVLVQEDGTLDFRVTRDQEGQELEHAEDQISRTVLDEVISTGQPLVLRNAMNDSRFSEAESVVILRLRSIMCVPLITRGEPVGALYVENRSIRNRFSEEDLPPLLLFANQAAIAIENAALNDELEARVLTRTRELKQAMLQVEKSWTEAIEANRLRMVWFSQIAHDLRAPLSIASGALSLLRDKALGEINEQQLDWITKSLHSVQHVAKLTEDIFELSRLDEGHLELNLDLVDLHKLLQVAYEMGLGLPWSNQVEFKLFIEDSLPMAYVDQLRIQQVLFNLLSNAQKFTQKGSVTLQTRHLADQEAVEFRVVDTGEGIPPEHVDELFERFKQFDRSANRRQRGTGLGLAICRQLVEMHGGKIWVESTLNEGSTFAFVLPLKPAPQ